MSTEIQSELEQFHAFIGEQLRNGGARISPEDWLDLWRANHPTSEELADSVAALKRALAQAAAGQGVTLEEFDRKFRDEFHVEGEDVLVLHVRGPGQAVMRPDEL